MEREIEKNITLILNNMKKIVTNPVGFFQSMPKSGGFVEPIIFRNVDELTSTSRRIDLGRICLISDHKS